ncbi:Acyl-CoA synthetase (AMP-forming)/AMP-acid ligase II [Lachnospiraceae bacterium NE2001]|nr:Acyl-CoA synthetase (AMP-forming)/AMP-acid ligase II [Lachnospiraceae bacterium NE2001]
MWDLQKFSENIALTDEFGKSIRYSKLQQENEKLYSVIGRRCLVFSMCQNSLGSIIGYTAFVNNGVVPVLLSAEMETELLANLLGLYKPPYIWLPEALYESIFKLSLDNNSEYNTQDDDQSSIAEIVYQAHDYILVKTNYDVEYPLNDDLCLLLTTSGSTGSPKFVRQSYTNVRSNAEAIAEYLALDSTEKPITTLPMNYTYGLSIINSHLLVGAEILVTDKGLMQKEFWNFFKEVGATSFGGVPYTYEMLDKLRFYRMDLPSLRYMTQAGGKITTELHSKFADYAEKSDKKFIVMYGQCEATARMGYLPAEYAVSKCGSMGIAIPGGRFHLIDESGEEITAPDTTGELVYEGPNVTLGYAEKGEDLALGDERGGVLHTGDMAQSDADGFYYIVGRKKRFLKIYGNRVNLDETERLIKGHFEGVDVACGGVDDHMYLFLAASSEALESSEDLKSFVVAKTKLNPAAFKVVVIDEIPKNDSGKTLYKALEVYYNVTK